MSIRSTVVRLVAGSTVGALAGVALVALAAPSASAAATAKPHTATARTAVADDTSSAVTVSGRGEFKGMKFTVSQTKDLTDQAVRVSWTGGAPTTFAGSEFNTGFVQIMQCWGNADDAVKSNPGPPRTQCEYGASPTTGRGTWPGNGYDDTRDVSYSAQPTRYGQDDTYGSDGSFGQGEVPFKAVNGEYVTAGTQNNKFFSYNTTNEIDFARTSPDGTGTTLFETATSLQAPQLGCGDPIKQADGSVKGRSCWLVIVPQGSLDLNGQPYADTTQVNAGSPVSSTNWANRIAVPLGFDSVGTSCKIGAHELDTTGSELVTDAMTSWQAKLCDSGTVYSYSELGDADARSQLSSDQAQLAFSSDAVGSDAGVAAPPDKVYNAPVALSGVVIAFNIDSQPGVGAPPADQALAGSQLTQVKLDPLLVAKLLTESYRNSPWGAVTTSLTGGAVKVTAAKGYDWAVNNPEGLITDPQFLALNPSFATMSISETPSTDTDLITALGHSDSAKELWKYVESDATARKFLAGIPDAYGMHVNPYYSTDPDVNPTGTAFDPNRDDYPKSDPWSWTATNEGPKVLAQGMTDFHPYVDDMHEGAVDALRGVQLWKSSWNALADPPAWQTPGPQAIGDRFQLVVTDAASAQRYGLPTAELLNSSGNYVAAGTASLSAAAATATGDPAVVSPKDATGKAYPLGMLVYAQLRPTQLTEQQRDGYSALIRYAVGAGQVSGVSLGELPLGYAPLSKTLKNQALAVAQQIDAITTTRTSSGASPSGSTTGTGATAGTTPGSGSSLPATGATGTPAPSAAAAPVTPDLETTAGGLTPGDPAVPLRLAVPIGAGLGLLAALLAPLAGGWRPRHAVASLGSRVPGRRTGRLAARLTGRLTGWIRMNGTIIRGRKR